MPTTLTVKGQVTIPVKVRRKLGLSTGDAVEFREEGGRYYLEPVPKRIEAAFGLIQLRHPVSEADIESAIAAGASRER